MAEEYDDVFAAARRINSLLVRHLPMSEIAAARDAVAALDTALREQGEKFRRRRTELTMAREEAEQQRARAEAAESELRELRAQGGV